MINRMFGLSCFFLDSAESKYPGVAAHAKAVDDLIKLRLFIYFGVFVVWLITLKSSLD